ncbi:MAG: tRNA epoxyqueuosine(34) reductase QueG [Nitrospina sp.]|jgi:epoxyqueuosine reductase|nr:tRNA epoxyqueuosine(34) reductase QueG [Nitrospina sp.]
MSLINEKTLRIENFAKELGFDGFGVTRELSSKSIKKYKEWLSLNYQGEMSYMSRNVEKRSSLNAVFAGVQSVVCLRTNYLTEDKDMNFINKKDRGDLSLYALNEDYHEVLMQRHKELEKKIKEEFDGCQTKIYIDTGPILEKPLAQSAGLGWIGKHTNLITEHIGSYYFISEILVDVILKVSEPSLDKCGTCRSCIDICPTKAIVAPYILDSRRCISYLTIELKGVIPLEFRKALGNHIYGCDDCQIVCPWNSFAVKTDDQSFFARDGSFQLIELMRLDDVAFRKRFKKSPVKRTKRRGLLRNVAVALGNSGNLSAVGPLIDALTDHEPLIRAHVVWALGELLGKKALPILDKTLTHENEDIVKNEVELLKQYYNKRKDK